MKYFHIDSKSRTFSVRDDVNPVAIYRSSLHSGLVERYHHVPGYELVVDAYGRDFEGRAASFTLAGLHVVGNGILKPFYGFGDQVQSRPSRQELEAMIEWHGPDYKKGMTFAEFARNRVFDYASFVQAVDDYGYEQYIQENRESCGYRFVITHGDASLWIDEVEAARIKVGLETIKDAGNQPIAFATNDPDEVEAYKALMSGWLWQVWDNEANTLDEPISC